MNPFEFTLDLDSMEYSVFAAPAFVCNAFFFYYYTCDVIARRNPLHDTIAKIVLHSYCGGVGSGISIAV